MPIFNNIIEVIGHTPLIRLNRVAAGCPAEILVKAEYFNPLGSVKDRIGANMIAQAEAAGLLGAQTTIVEPTSGNTGVGLAQIAASRGYRLILTMPAQMSEERKRTLTAYGAELVLTDPQTRMLGAIAEAQRLTEQLGAWMPNQFDNPANALAHYRTTGPEIYQQMEGRIDCFVYGSGTGGTIMGAGRFLKEQLPGLRVVAVEPARSNVLSGGTRGEHGFQGMGPGFIPPNLDVALLDEVVQAWEEDAYPLARWLARSQGLFVGMSSGAIAWAAVQLAQRLGPGHRVAAIACDSGARYLSTALFAGDSDTPPGYLPRSRERV